MGNSIPGVPAVPTDEIKEQAKTVMETFGPLYAKSFAIGLIQQLRKEAEAKAADADDFQLLEPPVPSDILCRGYVSKMGGFMKGWKRRWFVATNQADNFQIVYFASEEDEGDLSKKKGEIQPCGYRVKRLEMEEEVKEFGEHALTLKPWGRRRQWFLRFDSQEDLERWEPTLKMACSKRAYRMTRWRLDVWSWFSYDCTEEEALGNLVVDLCEADCMQPVYDKIPGGRLESKVRAAVTSTLDKTVGLAVGAAWKGIVGAAEKGKDDIEDKARDCIGPVFDKQAELEQKVSKLIVGVIAPPLEDITRPIMTPVCTVLMAPLAAAFKELCFSFYDKMSAIIADGITEADLSKFVREIRYWWGPMRPALVQVYKALRMGWEDPKPETARVTFSIDINLGDILDCFEGVDVWRVEEQFEDALRHTMLQAIYTFVHVLEFAAADSRDVSPMDVLAGTLARMVHDSRIHVVKQVTKIFQLIITPRIKRKVNPQIEKVLKPIEDLIPGPLKLFLDVDKMAENVMSKVVDGAIAKCVVPAAQPVCTMFDTVLQEVGIPA